MWKTSKQKGAKDVCIKALGSQWWFHRCGLLAFSPFESLLYARHCSKPLTCISSSAFYNHPLGTIYNHSIWYYYRVHFISEETKAQYETDPGFKPNLSTSQFVSPLTRTWLFVCFCKLLKILMFSLNAVFLEIFIYYWINFKMLYRINGFTPSLTHSINTHFCSPTMS